MVVAGTNGEYVRVFHRFIELAAPLEDVHSRIVIRTFLSGLKPTIKKELRMWAPSDLGRAMDIVTPIKLESI